jgi:two-component system, sensor histidine kinase PdtaS
MLSEAARRFAALPTAAKLLLILSAVLLPIGLALMLIAQEGIRAANASLRLSYEEQARSAARSIESLIARNVLALRIAGNAALRQPSADPCRIATNSLSVSPGVVHSFSLRDGNGRFLCSSGDIAQIVDSPLVAPGDIQVWIPPAQNSIYLRVGVIGGMATAALSLDELRSAVSVTGAEVNILTLSDGAAELVVLQTGGAPRGDETAVSNWRIAEGRLTARVQGRVAHIGTLDQLMIMLPLLMWLTAALLTWLLVTRLLIRPLRRLQRAVGQFQPGDSEFVLPRKLGPATEIQELRDAFARAVERVEESEHHMAAALEGQRRLVREVHHRVKNNLQVVASLLNIHGRSAESPEAREAYASISRRVGALSIVHRNHFAEMEENRGISLRPLLSEIAAELRAGAPDAARALRIDLDLDGANTTQDVAMSVAFLVTEIVEYAMLHRPEDSIEISLRRTSDLTAELSLGSSVLVPDEADTPEKVQFERIISGLAKQLRSDLERKLGRYSVDLPVFPPR